MGLLWGIDLGGTKTECVVLRAGDKEILARKRTATPVEAGYGAILQNIRRLMHTVARENRFPLPQTVGIGTPGTLDRETETLKNSNTTVLNGKPLLKELEDTLEMKVILENDANCFALAESTLGVVRKVLPQAQTVFGVILGTGVGGGMVCDGRVWKGRHGIAGEWGHNPLLENGDACYCGRRGCVETVISGPALERFYRQQSGCRRSLKEIVSLTPTDAAARATLERLVFFLGKALAVVVNILDPDAIVLGGGVGNVPALYEQVPAALSAWMFNDRLTTPLLKPALGDSAGVLGAALLQA